MTALTTVPLISLGIRGLLSRFIRLTASLFSLNECLVEEQEKEGTSAYMLNTMATLFCLDLLFTLILLRTMVDMFVLVC